MTDKVWKAAERAVAKFFTGAVRRGADYKEKFEKQGKSDIILDGFSVEVKHTSYPTYTLFRTALEQAVTAGEKEGDLPFAVIHVKGQLYADSTVVIRLSDFAEILNAALTVMEDKHGQSKDLE